MNLSPDLTLARAVTRRHFFRSGGLGFGASALQSLLAGPASASPSVATLAPRAKRVIYLHMAGSPSQLELFDHKPVLQKLHMQDAPKSFLEGKRFAFIRGVPKVLAGQFSFERVGKSGQVVSELLPHFRQRIADKACVIRTVHTDQFNHCARPALRAHRHPAPGRGLAGQLGHLRPGQRQPKPARLRGAAFRGKTPDAGKSLWGSADFCPPCTKACSAAPPAIPCCTWATRAAWTGACAGACSTPWPR
jgi:hypothetical protein